MHLFRRANSLLVTILILAALSLVGLASACGDDDEGGGDGATTAPADGGRRPI